MNKSISMGELREMMESAGGSLAKGEVILDVRTPEEFAEGHVAGSLNIPYEQVESALDRLKACERVYIYCRSGGRAQMAFMTLHQLGLQNLVCVSGSGMPDWIQAGYPVETGR